MSRYLVLALCTFTIAVVCLVILNLYVRTLQLKVQTQLTSIITIEVH